ncbi:MAG TPA: DUF1641 domain-containing protein [Acidimicrobiales bacterium]|nr:DUF1641 domain-containing protein [Acidimicrobiales bacterium]
MTIAEDSVRTGSSDDLDLALRDPQVRAALAVIAASAPEIAVMIAASNSLLARSREIMDNVNLAVAKTRGGVDFKLGADLINTLRVLGEVTPTIELLFNSPVLHPDVIDVIGRLGKAANEAEILTKGKKARVGGVLSLLRELKDPQVQETLAFVLAFAKSFGSEMSVGGDSK